MTLNIKSIIVHAFICKIYVFMCILGYLCSVFFKFIYMYISTHMYMF